MMTTIPFNRAAFRDHLERDGVCSVAQLRAWLDAHPESEVLQVGKGDQIMLPSSEIVDVICVVTCVVTGGFIEGY